MKTIEFKHFKVTDFQGISSFEFDFKGDTTTILGTNASGKSSVIDAIMWIITSKNQKNQSDSNFEIVPLDKEGRMIPTAEPHGILTVLVDGVEFIIERKLKLKVPKTKDGEIDYTHRFKTERSFFINGMNFKATQFNKELLDMFGTEETFKTLTNVIHFGTNKSEKDQRDLLLSYVNPVTHEMLCAVDERFKTLNELEKLPFSEVLNQTRGRINNYKEEVTGIKHRIDEIKLALVEFKDVDVTKFGELEVERTEIQTALNVLNKAMTDSSNSANEINSLKQDLMAIEYDIKNFNEKFESSKRLKVESLQRDINAKQGSIANCDTKKASYYADFDGLDVKISNATTEVDEIIANKTKELAADNTRKINSESTYFDDIINRLKQNIVNKRNEKIEDTCYACNQSLPLEGVELVKTNIQTEITQIEEKIEDTEKDKTGKLLQINNSHKNDLKTLVDSKDSLVKTRTQGYELEQGNIRESGKNNNTAKGNLEVELKQLETDMKTLEATVPNNDGKDLLFAKKSSIDKDIAKLSGSKVVSYDDIKAKQTELDVLNTKLNSKDSITRNKDRQEELIADQKLKIKGLSDLEDKKLLLEEYLKFKNDLLSKELKNHFAADITFKFIEFSQDGTPKDVFKMLINGVPYSNANTASRIIAGVQMIKFFQSKLEIKLPVLIDNRENIVIQMETEGLQVIQCIAHKDYPALTVE